MTYKKHLKYDAKALKRISTALLNDSINKRSLDLSDDVVHLELLHQSSLQFILALPRLHLIKHWVYNRSHQVDLSEHGLFIVLRLVNQNLPKVKSA